MAIDEHAPHIRKVSALLRRWLSQRAPEEGFRWLQGKEEQLSAGAPNRLLFTAFSAVPRYVGKADLALPPQALQDADAAREGWDPSLWSADQAGRTLLVLALPADDPERYVGTLDRIFSAADVGESVALYQGLPVLPHAAHFRARAAEGLRTNMTSVFNAVALRNPFPAAYFDEAAWNQMVLKAVFVGSPLYLIQGLDRRANATLARMLVDYAHERWAAGRTVTAELWRPVGPFAEEEVIGDLERVLAQPEPVQQEAAALALSQSPSPRAQAVLAHHASLRTRIENGTLTWDHFS